MCVAASLPDAFLLLWFHVVLGSDLHLVLTVGLKVPDLSCCCLPFAVWPVMFLSISFFLLKNVLFLLLFHLHWKYNDRNAGHYPRFH